MIALYHNNNVKKVFDYFLNNEESYFEVSQNSTDIKFIIINSSSFIEALILKNAQLDKIELDDLFSATYSQVIKNGNVYELKGRATKLEKDKPVDFSVFFESAEVEINIESALKTDFDDSPWKYLQNIADEIIKKYYFLGENKLNSMEKELLPLSAGICSMRFLSDFPEELRKYNLSQIIPFAEKLGFAGLDKPIGKITVKEIKNNFDYSFELFLTLNNVKYEPLWKEIYSLFELSQKEYEEQEGTEITESFKNKIQEYMISLGYIGTYPEFTKAGEIKGPITVESNAGNYTLFKESNVAFHVRFNENIFNNRIYLNALSSTEILKKDKSPNSAIYGMFDNKGHHFSVVSSFEFSNDNDDILYKSIDIAVKRAELKKLNSKEKDFCPADSNSSGSFLLNFVLMGGFFGISMAVIFAIINLVLDFAWQEDTFDFKFYLIIAAAGWILFGGTMWIISLITNKRR